MLQNQSMIVEKVKSALLETLPTLDIESITLKTKLKEDLGLDSMTSLTFLMTLEDKVKGFAVDPDTLEMNDLDCVESISDYVARQLQESEPC